MMSEDLAPLCGADGLRYSLVAGISLRGCGVVHFLISSKYYCQELVS